MEENKLNSAGWEMLPKDWRLIKRIKELISMTTEELMTIGTCEKEEKTEAEQE